MDSKDIIYDVLSSPLPPRPDAIATFLHSEDFLSGAQTLLHSIKHNLSKKIIYLPELIVFVTSNISSAAREKLCPAFCTRVIEIPYIPMPDSSCSEKSSHVTSRDGSHCGLTKLNIFRFEVYDTILLIDPDCLVLKDLSSLLNLGKNKYDKHNYSNILVAAAADISSPEKFDARVMVIHPSEKGFHDIIEKTKTLLSTTTFDDDAGFLNSYFPGWYRDMPASSRLPLQYNAHRCTYRNLGLGDNLSIVHFSSSPKPWEKKNTTSENDELDLLWNKWNQKSEKYERTWKEDKRWKEDNIKKAAKTMPPFKKKKAEPLSEKKKAKNSNEKYHTLVTKRFSELRKDGMDSKEAMVTARSELSKYELKDKKSNVGSQVASLFGLPM